MSTARPAALDVEALRADLRKGHHMLVDANDPVFLAVALNDLVLQRYVTQIAALNRSAQVEAATALSLQVDAAKSAASVVLTQSAQYITEQVRSAVDAQLKGGAEAADRRVLQAHQESRTARWAAAVALIAAGACLGLLLAMWR